MANQIAKLKNALGIGARANRYRVYFTLPSGVQRIQGVSEENLSLLCSSCDGFPATAGQSSSVFSQGRKFNLPKQQDNGGDWNATFYNDEAHRFRNTFLLWMKAIDHVPANSSTGSPISVMADISVAQLDSAENETVVCTFHDAFVTNVGAIAFDGTTSADVETFSVTFTYSYYTYGLSGTGDNDNIDDYNLATENPTAYNN